MRTIARLSVITLFMFYGVGLAQEPESQFSPKKEASAKEPPKEPQWYERVVGILGIPALRENSDKWPF
jgi:hypothetical protein